MPHPFKAPSVSIHESTKGDMLRTKHGLLLALGSLHCAKFLLEVIVLHLCRLLPEINDRHIDIQLQTICDTLMRISMSYLVAEEKRSVKCQNSFECCKKTMICRELLPNIMHSKPGVC